MHDDRDQRLFTLGKVVATQGALAATTHEERQTFLFRHQTGDWAEMDQEQRAQNWLAYLNDLRIVSTHKTLDGKKVWIITEADRSVTTILLPEEY